MSAGVSRRARVVVVTTHPVQYHVPWLRGLAGHPRLDLHVLYGLIPSPEQQGVGFGVAFRWDHDLLEGYRWSLLENRAAEPALGRWSGVDTPGVGRHLARLAPDVVLVCGWQARSLVQATRAARRLGLPLLVRGESNDLRARARWKHWVHRIWLAQFDAALAIGRSSREFLRAAGVREDALFDACYAVPTEHLAPAVAGRATLRASARAGWGLEPDACVVAFVGKLQPKKRPLDLVRAVARLMADLPGLRLLVTGSGELEGAVREAARELGVPCTFTGFLNQGQLAAAYAAADLLVLPSDHGETWGLVVNEAQVCGLPVVVSDQVGCGPDLVEDGVTGWTYPCGDVPALAERIRGLARDPALRQRMGEAGRQRVAAYSVEAAVEGTVQAVEAVLARREAKATLRA